MQSENFTPSLSSNELNDEDLIQEGQARATSPLEVTGPAAHVCGSFDDLDRAALAQELERIEGERAKQRQSATLPKEGEKGFQAVCGSNDPDIGRARDIAARKVGLSPTMYHRAKTIIDKGSDELKQAVREGKTSVSYAYKKIMSKERSLVTPPLPEGLRLLRIRNPKLQAFSAARRDRIPVARPSTTSFSDGLSIDEVLLFKTEQAIRCVRQRGVK